MPEVTPTAIFRLLRRRSRSSSSANEPHVWTSLRTGKLSFVSVPDDAASQRRVQASQRVLLVDDRLEDAAIGVADNLVGAQQRFEASYFGGDRRERKCRDINAVGDQRAFGSPGGCGTPFSLRTSPSAHAM